MILPNLEPRNEPRATHEETVNSSVQLSLNRAPTFPCTCLGRDTAETIDMILILSSLRVRHFSNIIFTLTLSIF